MYRTTIGLEIHIQLNTKSKMFCRCSNDGENKPPNTTICPVCMGHPGTLPVANKQAIISSARMALALQCTIRDISKFDRKNYYYPDLPKGYQISQYDQPIGVAGYVDVQLPSENGRTEMRVRINRLHLEEDAAKLLHAAELGASLVDFNRCSTPLMEVVTEPDIKTPLEAKIFLHELRLLARYLGVSHADMEKGHLRCDANVSVQFDVDGVELSTPISEIKNLNSFRSVEHALQFEAKRLYNDWMDGGETRNRTNKITVGWDDDSGTTVLQRGKEEAHDYKYFPEPDLPPIRFTDELRVEFMASIPELPARRRLRFCEEYEISESDSKILVEDKALGDYFEKCASEFSEWLSSAQPTTIADYRLLSSWLINKLCARITDRSSSIDLIQLSPENFAELISLIAQNTINSSVAQTILDRIIDSNESPRIIVQDEQLHQVSDTSLIESAAKGIVANNQDAVVNYKNGKSTAIMFLVGQVMKEMKGKAQPDIVKSVLENLLKS